MSPLFRNPGYGPATPNNYTLLSGSLVLKDMSVFYTQILCQSVPMYMLSPVGSLMFEHSISLLVCHARCSTHLDIPVISKQYLRHVVMKHFFRLPSLSAIMYCSLNLRFIHYAMSAPTVLICLWGFFV